MIVTEPPDKSVMCRILPTNRTIGDTRKMVYYYRPSPDRSRVVFGGRVTSGETDPVEGVPRGLMRHSSQIARAKPIAAVMVKNTQ